MGAVIEVTAINELAVILALYPTRGLDVTDLAALVILRRHGCLTAYGVDHAASAEAVEVTVKLHTFRAKLIFREERHVAVDGNVVNYTNATIDVFGDGTQYKLVGMGAMMSNNPSKGLSLAAMVRANANNEDLLDIPVKYLYNLDEETGAASFAVRITNIPVECEETIIYARPYYIFEDAEGNQIEVYDHVEYANYADNIVMNDGVLDWD